MFCIVPRPTHSSSSTPEYGASTPTGQSSTTSTLVRQPSPPSCFETPNGETFAHVKVQIDGRYSDIDAQGVLGLGEDAHLEKCTADIQQTHLVLFVFKFIFLFKLAGVLRTSGIELPTAIVSPFALGQDEHDNEVEANERQSKTHINPQSSPRSTLRSKPEHQLRHRSTSGEPLDASKTSSTRGLTPPNLSTLSRPTAPPHLAKRSARTRSSPATMTTSTLSPPRCPPLTKTPLTKTPTILGVPTRTSSLTKPSSSRRSRTT